MKRGVCFHFLFWFSSMGYTMLAHLPSLICQMRRWGHSWKLISLSVGLYHKLSALPVSPLSLQMRYGTRDSAKAIFYRALQSCPWAKVGYPICTLAFNAREFKTEEAPEVFHFIEVCKFNSHQIGILNAIANQYWTLGTNYAFLLTCFLQRMLFW